MIIDKERDIDGGMSHDEAASKQAVMLLVGMIPSESGATMGSVKFVDRYGRPFRFPNEGGPRGPGLELPTELMPEEPRITGPGELSPVEREALGDGPTVDGMHVTDSQGAGMHPEIERHHVLPQEYRPWFEERGFTGDMNIDKFTVDMQTWDHQATHLLDYNSEVMGRLEMLESIKGAPLTPDEILGAVRDMMPEFGIEGPFVDYNGPRP
jgi:hypothetical protein